VKWVAPLAVDEVVFVQVWNIKTSRWEFTGAKVKGKQVGFDPVRPGWIAVELCEGLPETGDYRAGDVITRAASMLYRRKPVTHSEAAQRSELERAGAKALPQVHVRRGRIVPEESTEGS